MKNKETYIRSTNHSMKFSNSMKAERISLFIGEYQNAVFKYIDWIWNHGFEWKPGRICDIRNEMYDVPSMISTTGIPIESKLSCRALKCAATQACGIVAGCFKRRNKDLFIKQKCLDAGKPIPTRIQERLNTVISMPTAKELTVNPELNSICVSVEDGKNSFDKWIRFHSLFNDARGEKICIPIKLTKMDRKYESGKILNSILISSSGISLRYELEIKKSVGTKIIGIDQGIKTCITTSDGQTTKKNPHNHDLEYCIRRISRTKRGSKNNKRAIIERDNIIGYAVNQINFNELSEIRYEKHFDTKRGKRLSRLLTHFSNPVLQNRIERKAIENGVRFLIVENSFNSQRCCVCGWTQKANRNAKRFRCRKCGNETDADLNAAKNILNRPFLPKLTFASVPKGANIQGFFWNASTGKGASAPEVGCLQSPTVQN